MRTFDLDRRTSLPVARAEVFDFFSDPKNLELITPDWLHFRLVSSTDDPIREGTRLRYRLRLHGIPMRWTSRITAWDPPHRFVDEQERGPYRRWVHTHTFAERDGTTEMRDSVVYAVHGGRLVDRLLVRRDLEGIFDHREKRIRAVFASE